MVRVIKLFIYLIILGGIGLAGYAYLGDLSPQRSDVRAPVKLNVH